MSAPGEGGGATLAELRARKAEREEADQRELDAIEAEALLLEEKYVAQGQKEGVDFSVVPTRKGNFVVRKPDFVVAKRFNDSKEKGAEEVIHFVMPCLIEPAAEKASQIFRDHGGVAYRLALACLKLYEADVGDRLGK